MPAGLKLKTHTKILAGQNGRQGIDGVGVLEDGRPVILEFTLGKDLGEATAVVDGRRVSQMSREWTEDRWRRWIVEDPALSEELRWMGVAERFLDPKTYRNALKDAPRYFVTTTEGKVRGLARLLPEKVEVLRI